MDAGAVAYLAPLVISQDAKLKRQVGFTLVWAIGHVCAKCLGHVLPYSFACVIPDPCPPQVCCSLSQIAKHSVDLAEVVVGAEIFPKILTCLKFPDEFVKVWVIRKSAATTPNPSVSPPPPASLMP